MSKRDVIAELLEVKARQDQRNRAEDRLGDLRRAWGSQKQIRNPVADFFPIGIVTCLEVFARKWIAALVDKGTPFLENSQALTQGMKFDFAVAMALQGKRVSLGEIIAHDVSLNRIDQFFYILSTITGKDINKLIVTVYDRFEVERANKPPTPIIKDVGVMRESLSKLFQARHIVTHELPKIRPYDLEDIDKFFSAAFEFVRAIDQTLMSLVYGNYPLTTLEASDEQCRLWGLANEEMEEVLSRIKQIHGDDEILQKSQSAWESYCKHQAEFRSSIVEGGSLQPVVYGREMVRLIQVRTKELRWWLDREEGDI